MRLIFKNVERETDDPARIRKLKAEGYEEMDPVPQEESEEQTEALEEMSVSAMRALAKRKGLDGTSGLNKEELLAVLKDVI